MDILQPPRSQAALIWPSLFLLVFTCALDTTNAGGQTTKKKLRSSPAKVSSGALPCRIQLLAPVVRGITLGMTAKELFTLYPVFQRDYQLALRDEENRVRNGGISMALLGIYSFSHQIYDNRGYQTDENPQFDGLNSIDVSFYDNKVLDLAVRYEDYQPVNINDFVKQVVETLKLPEQGWKTEPKSASLECSNIKINLSFGIVGNTSLLQLQNLTLYKEMNRKTKEKTEAEERRRRVFKP